MSLPSSLLPAPTDASRLRSSRCDHVIVWPHVRPAVRGSLCDPLPTGAWLLARREADAGMSDLMNHPSPPQRGVMGSLLLATSTIATRKSRDTTPQASLCNMQNIDQSAQSRSSHAPRGCLPRGDVVVLNSQADACSQGRRLE